MPVIIYILYILAIFYMITPYFNFIDAHLWQHLLQIYFFVNDLFEGVYKGRKM
jgi:hypothetical protein